MPILWRPLRAREGRVAEGKGERRLGEVDLARVAALSDGIFAVAMTLLVVALPLPKSAAELSGATLRAHLLTLLPPVRAILISFFIAAVFWRAHHKLFRCLARGDGVVVWLDFVLLFAVVVMPLSTHLLGNFRLETLTVGLYAANLALIAGSLFLMWLRVAVRRALLHHDIGVAELHHALWITAVTALVFLGSIAIAWPAPQWAVWIWALILPLSLLGPRRPAGKTR